jgi:hypothetical protein
MIQRYRRPRNQTPPASRLSSMRTAVTVRSAALVAIALIAGGCGRSTLNGTGRPVPASAVPRLMAIADRTARINGDPHPVWVTVVLTTHAKALTSATPGDIVPGADGVPVYLVTMRGHFVCNACSHPPGAKAPRGTYLSLVLIVKTFEGTDFGLSPKPPPVSPASLGPVTYLIGHPA